MLTDPITKKKWTSILKKSEDILRDEDYLTLKIRDKNNELSNFQKERVENLFHECKGGKIFDVKLNESSVEQE